MAKSRDLRIKTRRKRFKIIAVFCILFVVGNMLVRSELPSLLWKMGMMAVKNHTIPISDEWNLIVVNRWNEIPENYSVTLTELENGQKVDSRIYPDLQEMFDTMRLEGIYPTVREGYRTAEEQQEILEERIQRYMNEGYSRSRAERTAKKWVAVPGTSEHQLGITVDTLISLLMEWQQNRSAFIQDNNIRQRIDTKAENVKDFSVMVAFLQTHKIETLEDLQKLAEDTKKQRSDDIHKQ